MRREPCDAEDEPGVSRRDRAEEREHHRQPPALGHFAGHVDGHDRGHEHPGTPGDKLPPVGARRAIGRDGSGAPPRRDGERGMWRQRAVKGEERRSVASCASLHATLMASSPVRSSALAHAADDRWRRFSVFRLQAEDSELLELLEDASWLRWRSTSTWAGRSAAPFPAQMGQPRLGGQVLGHR